MKKLVDENTKTWHKHLYEVMWADRITPKREIGMAPFELVYGIRAQVALPLELAASRLQTVIEDQLFRDFIEKQIMCLTKLEEEREELIDRITLHQAHVKKICDKKARPRKFMEGDEVLLWDKQRDPKGAHGKFDSLWKGPFKIHQVLGPNSFKLSYADVLILPLSYNEKDLKIYRFSSCSSFVFSFCLFCSVLILFWSCFCVRLLFLSFSYVELEFGFSVFKA